MKKIFIVLVLLFMIVNTIAESNYNVGYSKNFSWAESKLKSMTLREKIAQMIITYSDGYYLDDDEKEFKRLKNLIENEKVGGVIFFKGKGS